MKPMRKLGVRATLLVFLSATLFLAGCSATDPITSTSSDSPDPISAEEKIFSGTLEERMQALASCLNDSGFPTEVITQAGDFPRLRVSFGSDDAYEAAMEAQEKCDTEIGAMPEESIDSVEEVDEMFNWVSGQHSCLEAAGFALQPMHTKEAYLDEWNRTGAVQGDALGYLVDFARDQASALELCPRTTESW